jgi:hypothetical protein
VEITAALAADLAVLSEALDDSDADLVEELRQLVADVKLAVRSYLGLTVIASNSTFPLSLTAMEDFAHPDDVMTSLMIPLSDHDGGAAGSGVVLILYAARGGAFVDLAADLSWLTGRHLSDFALDQHLSLPVEMGLDGVLGSSLVNQAIGVLIGRGYTPEQAELEIDTRAAASGHTHMEAATIILADLHRGGPDPALDG